MSSFARRLIGRRKLIYNRGEYNRNSTTPPKAKRRGSRAIRVEELDFDLPAERIAQHPVSPRDASKLMVVQRDTGTIRHAVFQELPEHLRAGDCLVLNQTRVLPAKFALRRETGGRIGGLFLGEPAMGRWRVLLAGAGRIREGEVLLFERGRWKVTISQRFGEGEFEIAINPLNPAVEILTVVGQAPLPPYIKRDAAGYSDDLRDKLDYQTVFAREPGSVAAPTAGLHFTADLLDRVRAKGVETASLTLHVGRGTFLPVSVADLDEHPMHAEWYEVKPDAAGRINDARKRGGRIVAVGTTSMRVLETCADNAGIVQPGTGWTKLLIQPPYRFKAVDAAVTNFHLPRSTLLALVFALGGVDLIRKAYREAIDRDYRFFSFGDAMFIV